MCCSISGIAITGKRKGILEAKQGLFCDYLDQSDWDSGLVIPFDEGKKIFTKRLKHETDMDVLGCTMME